MPDKAVYLLVVPGFADWEPAHAVAELRRHGHYRVEVAGLTREAVRSMGGVDVLPGRTIADVDVNDVAVFIVPGGDGWESHPLPAEITPFLQRLDEHRVPIAAICAATTVVAKSDLLRGRRHTSNSLAYLKKQVPSYAEQATYVDEPAVRDAGLITASGLADVEFAALIMEELGVLTAPLRAQWTRLFRGGRIPVGAAG
jgi:putative intracellular protease/amidase